MSSIHSLTVDLFLKTKMLSPKELMFRPLAGFSTEHSIGDILPSTIIRIQNVFLMLASNSKVRIYRLGRSLCLYDDNLYFTYMYIPF